MQAENDVFYVEGLKTVEGKHGCYGGLRYTSLIL